MFRNLTEKITDALSGTIIPGNGNNGGGRGRHDREKVRRIMDMGFTADQAKNALDATGDGNVERAVEMLLGSTTTTMAAAAAGGGGGGGPRQSPSPARSTAATVTATSGSSPIDMTADEKQLQRAMEASLESHQERQQRAGGTMTVDKKKTTTTTTTAKATARSAASARAGQAALNRFETPRTTTGGGGGTTTTSKKKAKSKSPPRGRNTTTTTTTSTAATTTTTTTNNNPLGERDIQTPAPLQSKSKEEQITRCANRVAPHPLAVDTLLRSLTCLKNDPSNIKYRSINKTNPGYRRSLGDIPGAEDMFLAVNFTPKYNNLNELYLTERNVDMALLFLAISSLEQIKLNSEEYAISKRKIEFHKTVTEIRKGMDRLSTKSLERETIARAGYMSKCPTEPQEGRGALVQVTIGDETVRRRFDGDDTLRDVVNWIGGHGSLLPEKILSREWSIIDLNRYPLTPVDCSNAELHKTLQVIGCWPSGKLELRESDEEWRIHGTLSVQRGSARGLGAHHHH